MRVIFAIRLEPDGSPNERRKYIRLPPPNPQQPYFLRFILPAGCVALKRGCLFTNYPVIDEDNNDETTGRRRQFDRNHFMSITFDYDYITDGSCQMAIHQAGAYEYYVRYFDEGQQRQSERTGHFIVEPRMMMFPRLPMGAGGSSALELLSVPVPQQPLKALSTSTGDLLATPVKTLSRANAPSATELASRVASLNEMLTKDESAPRSPTLTATAAEPHLLNMDSLSMVTVISKWLGPISLWRPHFRYLSDCGYNAVHFVPLQHRGVSNSPYSIYDQLALSPDLFEPAELSGPLASRDAQFARLRREFEYMHKEFSLLSVTDIVWNHTACNSAWLSDHPEAGYNLINSPHLRPAFELDEAILEFSRNIEKHGLSPYVTTAGELDRLMTVFKERVLGSLKLWEYYVLDVSKLAADLEDMLAGRRDIPAPGELPLPDDVDHLPLAEKALFLRRNASVRTFGQRLSNSLATPPVLAFVKKWFSLTSLPVSKPDLERIMIEYRKLLDEVNLAFYKEYDDDMAVALGNIKNRVEYERIASHGPKLSAINGEHPLMSTYFTRIPVSDANRHMDRGALAVANNGWIWNADPLVDFASSDSKAYLRREVIPWGDCVKLRYGKGPDDNPWLWEHIRQYTVLMAEYFHGFRIDNCHSTPLHVAQYFLDCARRVRPDLYVVAELFTGSEERDITFVSRLGINSLIREAIQAWDPQEMSRLVHKYGGQPTGSLALRADYLPLQVVGHHTADMYSHDMEKFHQSREGWVYNDDVVEQDHLHLTLNFRGLGQSNGTASLAAMVDDPDESGRRTPLSLRHRQRSTSRRDRSVEPPSARHTGTLHIGRHEPHPEQELPESPLESHTEKVFMLKGSSPHALFMDLTHDNQTPHERRTAEDFLTNNALVCMTISAIGSIRGYDELVPHHLNVVLESRRYMKPDLTRGIAPASELFQKLHYLMGQKGYTEVHVHQEQDFVQVHRQNPFTHHGYLLIARTAFKGGVSERPPPMSPITLRNTSFKTLLAARTKVRAWEYKRDEQWINGLPAELEMSTSGPLKDMMRVEAGADELGHYIRLYPVVFPAGAVLLLETDMHAEAIAKFEQLKSSMSLRVHGTWYLDGIVREDVPGLVEALSGLTPVEMNIVLYRSNDEERDATGGHGVYNVPGIGELPYAGLHGCYSYLREATRRNDLGAPICEHLRQGPWLMDFLVQRLERYQPRYPQLAKFRQWLSYRFELIKKLPAFLVPKYFNIVVSTACYTAKTYCLSLMSPFVMEANRFVRSLAMTTIQLYGWVPSSGLTPVELAPGLAAGLSHFSHGVMRTWGRDVFISLRGLFLVTGMHDVARQHILAFASTLKHGLLPNLLASGRFPRYNARDATWFFVQSVQDYCEFVENGERLLDEVVPRRFDSDQYVDYTDQEHAFRRKSTLREILVEIMERHANGIEFVEHNAGPQLDRCMSPPGFRVRVWTDLETGLVFGGNQHNCGTWMDKMGSSEKAGLKGVPATPRDGAAVEITGLVKSAVRWMRGLAERSAFPAGVPIKERHGQLFTFSEWDRRLQENFERYFWIPETPQEDSQFAIDCALVHRRGVYKDTYRATHAYCDYQLRPNFPIAMVVAPELFTRERAVTALKNTTVLLGPLGMKTLDPEDWRYRPNYDNANDSDDPTVAHGINYHQGPEWLWVTGYYLRALYRFIGMREDRAPDCQLLHDIQRYLYAHRRVLETSPWSGLPELTNHHGAYCRDSCQTQAWSSATLLDLLHDIRDDVVACSLIERPSTFGQAIGTAGKYFSGLDLSHDD